MIRHATRADVPALIELGTQMFMESRYNTSPFSPEKCAALACSLIDAPAGIVLVEESGGQIAGWLAGGIGEQWFSHELMAFEYGLFIAPAQRGGSAAFRMVKMFIRWARDNGASVINMGITTGVHEQRTGELYERLGLVRVGTLFSGRF